MYSGREVRRVSSPELIFEFKRWDCILLNRWIWFWGCGGWWVKLVDITVLRRLMIFAVVYAVRFALGSVFFVSLFRISEDLCVCSVSKILLLFDRKIDFFTRIWSFKPTHQIWFHAWTCIWSRITINRFSILKFYSFRLFVLFERLIWIWEFRLMFFWSIRILMDYMICICCVMVSRVYIFFNLYLAGNW